MKAGDVLRLRTLRHYPDRRGRPAANGDVLWTDATAPRGKVFVCVILGIDGRDDGEPLDVNQALVELGWTPPPAPEEAAG